MKNIISLAILAIAFPLLCSAQGVKVSTSPGDPEESAIFEVESSSQGFLPPRMNIAQRNSIQNPVVGLQIYNTELNCLEVYTGTHWKNLCFGDTCGSPPPAGPLSGIHEATEAHIIWNWQPAPGALGYRYSFTNNFYSANENELNTSFIQTSFLCETNYTLFVWAYNSCGPSPVTTLSQVSAGCFVCGTSGVTFLYKSETVTYGTVIGQAGKCWMDRNLGASQVATSRTDVNSYGDLFQWGRPDDGHQNRTSNTTSTLSNSDVPGNNTFILVSGSPDDWRTPQNNSLWQGTEGINNPCPPGWRLPTSQEFNAEHSNWSPPDYDGAFNSPLKLPCAGFRQGNNAAIVNAGTNGRYWSSSISGTNALHLFFHSGKGVTGEYRSFGHSIRCIQE
jgi:hypothetical protein